MSRVYLCVMGLSLDPPTLGDLLSKLQLQQGNVFVFNCTPVPGNPEELNITFMKDGSPVTLGSSITVQGPLLTIPSAQRSDSGNYSCTVANTAGMTTVFYSLAVVGVCAVRALCMS